MLEQSTKVYLDALIKALKQKLEVLDEVIAFNKKQEELILTPDYDLELLDALIENKQLLIEEMNGLDQLFETNYSRVKEDLLIHKELYRTEIQEIQQFVRQLIEQSISINASELRIKKGVESSFSSLRQKVKQYNTNSRTVNQYYKNMANQHIGQAYFIDKKK